MLGVHRHDRVDVGTGMGKLSTIAKVDMEVEVAKHIREEQIKGILTHSRL
jgi:hypothetical protein